MEFGKVVRVKEWNRLVHQSSATRMRSLTELMVRWIPGRPTPTSPPGAKAPKAFRRLRDSSSRSGSARAARLCALRLLHPLLPRSALLAGLLAGVASAKAGKLAAWPPWPAAALPAWRPRQENWLAAQGKHGQHGWWWQSRKGGEGTGEGQSAHRATHAALSAWAACDCCRGRGGLCPLWCDFRCSSPEASQSVDSPSSDMGRSKSSWSSSSEVSLVRRPEVARRTMCATLPKKVLSGALLYDDNGAIWAMGHGPMDQVNANAEAAKRNPGIPRWSEQFDSVGCCCLLGSQAVPTRMTRAAKAQKRAQHKLRC